MVMRWVRMFGFGYRQNSNKSFARPSASSEFIY